MKGLLMSPDQQSEGTNPTRRDVIKATAVTSAAAMFAALGTNFAHAQGTDIIKVGLIGCGGRGSGAAGNCVEGAAPAGAQAGNYAVGDVFKDNTKQGLKSHKVDKDKIFARLHAPGGVLNTG